MGGQEAVEVASKMGTHVLVKHCRDMAQSAASVTNEHAGREYYPATVLLLSGVPLSNAEVYKAAEKDKSMAWMGSTLVVVQIADNDMSMAHVGDSRVYLLRQKELKQLTNDHSLVMEQVRLGMLSREDAESSKIGNVMLRALCAEPDVEVDLDEVWLQVEDTVLLCSDGLTRTVSDNDIARILNSYKDPQHAVNQLVVAAIENGGEDNITVIVIRTLPSKTYWLKKLAGIFQKGDGKWLN